MIERRLELLRRHEGEALLEIEAHLIAEDGTGARSRPIGFRGPVVPYTYPMNVSY